MSVKLSRYVFRMIKGRIIPIRKDVIKRGISKQGNRILDKISKLDFLNNSSRYFHSKKRTLKELAQAKIKLRKEAKFIGTGVDFKVYGGFRMGRTNYVLKLPKNNPTRRIKSKEMLRRYPDINDKVARSKALADELPNWNVPTVHTETVRINRKNTAILQEKVESVEEAMKKRKTAIGDPKGTWQHTQREAKYLKNETGLSIDAHLGNMTKEGYLFDTALGYPLPSTKNVKGYGHDLLDEIKSHSGVTDYVSESAMLAAPSKKAMKKLNEQIKKGYKLKKKSRGSRNYKLVKSPMMKKEAAMWNKSYVESKAEELSASEIIKIAKRNLKK